MLSVSAQDLTNFVSANKTRPQVADRGGSRCSLPRLYGSHPRGPPDPLGGLSSGLSAGKNGEWSRDQALACQNGNRFSFSRDLILALLLRAGIEPNPGPPTLPAPRVVAAGEAAGGPSATNHSQDVRLCRGNTTEDAYAVLNWNCRALNEETSGGRAFCDS